MNSGGAIDAYDTLLQRGGGQHILFLPTIAVDELIPSVLVYELVPCSHGYCGFT